MSKTNSKKISKILQLLPIIFFLIIGALCGVFIGKYMVAMKSAGKATGEIIFNAVLLFIGMYIAIFIQIVIHEAGHLLFGLMTGYRFSSFRVGSLMWLKEGETIKLKRLTIAGTGGQCLLNPPEMMDGKYPYVLYNLGGSIINIVSALVFAGIAFICKDTNLIFSLLMMFAVVGIAYAFMNGFPMKFGTVNNDGYNALSIGKDREARKSFWIQMRANHLIATGIQTKDMPEEWFEIPSEEAMKNSMIAVMGVFACNRLMNQMKFDEVNQTIERLLQMKTGIVGLHRSLLIVDQIYCELVDKNRPEKLGSLLDADLKKFMKLMKNYPSVLRTQYVYALLAEKDATKAAELKTKFEKIAEKYPYPSEIVAERELIEYAFNLSNE